MTQSPCTLLVSGKQILSSGLEYLMIVLSFLLGKSYSYRVYDYWKINFLDVFGANGKGTAMCGFNGIAVSILNMELRVKVRYS